MISAIAARKAAQAAQGQHDQPPRSQLSPDPPPQSPKRKHSIQRSRSATKKQKHERRQGKITLSPAPLFNVSKSSSDVIVIDADDDEQSSRSEASEVEISSASPSHLTQRAWSPSLPPNDSSLDEDTTGLIDVPARLLRPPPAEIGKLLSTFSPISGHNTFFLSADEVGGLGVGNREKGTVIVLEERDTLCLLGACRLALLSGCLKINGVSLQPSLTMHNIFSPRSSPLPIITGSTCSNNNNCIVDVSHLPEYLHPIRQSRSNLILIQECQSGVEALGHICRTFEGVYTHHGPQNDSISSPFRINGLHLVTKQTQDIIPFTLPTSWFTSLTGLFAHPSTSTSISTSSLTSVFLVKGPKKCGKSTFARVLFNTLLNRYKRVAFLECDIGQSEFTPGGLVSLHVLTRPVFGPPYTHPSLPFRAHFIGATTPKTSPNSYLEAVRDLIEVWKLDILHGGTLDVMDDDERDLETIPLVINTMGWNKGLGANLMEKIEEMAEPSWVFNFKNDDDFSYSNFSDPSSRHPALEAQVVYTLGPAPLSILSTYSSAADHRKLSILSYFHSVFSLSPKPSNHTPMFDQAIAQSWDASLPLCAIQPYEIDICDGFDKIILRGAGSEDIVPGELSRVLNGAVVGLVRSDHSNRYSEPSPRNHGVPYTQGQPPPLPSESSCIGLGLVRAVSIPSTSSTSDSVSPARIQLLTPIPPALLTGVRILVKGEMELPVWGMLDFRELEGGVAGIEKGKVPYLQWGRGSEGAVGTEKKRVRRNLMRRGQA